MEALKTKEIIIDRYGETQKSGNDMAQRMEEIGQSSLEHVELETAVRDPRGAWERIYKRSSVMCHEKRKIGKMEKSNELQTH